MALNSEINYMNTSITDNILVYAYVLQFNFRGIQLHRKEFYTLLSLLLGTFLFGALINDFVSIINVEMPENSTHEFTFTVLVSTTDMFIQVSDISITQLVAD